jgi:E3 ubiquitin-protein ligase SHPRH
MRTKQARPRRRPYTNEGVVQTETTQVAPRRLEAKRPRSLAPAQACTETWLDIEPAAAADSNWFAVGMLDGLGQHQVETFTDSAVLHLRASENVPALSGSQTCWSLRFVSTGCAGADCKPPMRPRKRKAPDDAEQPEAVSLGPVPAALVESVTRLCQRKILTLAPIPEPIPSFLVLVHRERCLAASLRQEMLRRDLHQVLSWWHPQVALAEARLQPTAAYAPANVGWCFRSARGVVNVQVAPRAADERSVWGEAPWVYEAMRRLPSDVDAVPEASPGAPHGAASRPLVSPEVPGLRPRLRPYQCRAVTWMLERERHGIAWESLAPVCIPDTRGGGEYAPLLFHPLESVATAASTSGIDTIPEHLVYGGMLCDEMGLGKTVELLACILLERAQRPVAGNASGQSDDHIPEDGCIRQSKRVCCECGRFQNKPLVHALIVGRARKRYFCEDCAELLHSDTPLPSKSTLIVCPSIILRQWESEIRKHVEDASLDVVVYQGLHRETYQRLRRLRRADVVLTTYDALRADVNRAHENILRPRSLRYEKRYRVAPTPLTRIEWERVCLDEAQMIRGGVAAAAAMALQLHAHKRWCITGTPVRRSVDDLESLVRFLRFEPFCEPEIWRKWLIRPCERNGSGASLRLAQLIRALAWRSQKADVWMELNLPPQFEIMQNLSLGPVERHYYNRQHETCVSFVQHLLNARVAKYLEEPGSLLKSASRRGYGLVRSVLHHLKVLRQACCHPRLAPGGFGGSSTGTGLEANMMTMDQVLDVLIQRARLECEEAQRSLVASLNGLAAIAWLRGQPADAVRLYRAVLQRAQEPKQANFVEIDPLQRYHVLVNLAQVLEKHPAERLDFGVTLRDDCLRSDADALREAYLRERREQVQNARRQLQRLSSELERCAHAAPVRLWWMTALDAIERADCGQWLLDRLEEDGIVRQLLGGTQTLSLKALRYALVRSFDALEQSRRTLLDRLLSLPGNGDAEPSEAEVRASGTCRQCREDMLGEPCRHCESEDLFDAYERCLFAVRTRLVNASKAPDATTGDRLRRAAAVITEGDGGVRLASELERALRFIAAALRRLDADADTGVLGESAAKEWERFALLKKEFTHAHVYFRAQKDYLGALDELIMAATRITLRAPGEQVSESERRYRILEAEIESTALALELDRRLAEEQSDRKKGQLVYLQRLKSSCVEDLAAKRQEPCPICYRQLGSELVLLPCGHCFCIECTSSYLEARVYRQHSRSLPCPLCREVCNTREVSFIQTGAASSQSAMAPIKGSFGAKIEAVVRDLLFIQEYATRQVAERGPVPDATHRCVVFSLWSELLQILSAALERNNIPHVIGDVEAFRGRREPMCALLLPIRIGANGLNLVEARHVFLLEPLLDPAAELQAIGRVHRIGQTCCTYVHRYVVQGTVEEQVQAISASHVWQQQQQQQQHQSTGQCRARPPADMLDTHALTLADLRSMFEPAGR